MGHEELSSEVLSLHEGLSEHLSTYEGMLLTVPKSETQERQTIEMKMVEEVKRYFDTNGFAEVVGLEAIQDIMDRANENGVLMVRRESLMNLKETIENHGDYDLTFTANHGDPYPNAAYYHEGDGLKEVYTRGFSQIKSGAITFIVGFQPSKEMQIQPIGPQFDYYTPQALEINRMVSGPVHFADVKFVLVRYARNSFPDNQLTEDEQEREEDKGLRFVTRLYSFAKDKTV